MGKRFKHKQRILREAQLMSAIVPIYPVHFTTNPHVFYEFSKTLQNGV